MACTCLGCGGPLLDDSVAPTLRSACPRCLAHLLLADPSRPPDAKGNGSIMGGHQLIHEIARGGMGSVWLAARVLDGVLVALKLLPHGLGTDPSRLARFRAEATLAARLVHPHIVAIRDIGEHEGVPYFTMDLVDGPDLGEVASRRPMPPREAARIVRTVGLAVHFAHEQGVLHRDIKPTNILLGTDGEPRVTDFGLARLLDMDARLTATGETMGSPSFMAPEQVNEQSQPSGVRTDVHGLGGLLYFCLTGRAPFAASSVAAALAKVAASKPIPPREWVPGIPEPLEAITMRCLAREPSARYPNAALLADDLERALTGQPVSSMAPSTPREVPYRWLSRRPWLWALFLAPACLGAAASAAWAIARQRSIASEARQSVLQSTALARYALDIAQAGHAADANDAAGALRLLEGCLPSPPMPDPRGLEWFVLRRRVATLDGVVHPNPGPRPAESRSWQGWPSHVDARRILYSADSSVMAVGFGPQTNATTMAWRLADPSAAPVSWAGFPLDVAPSGQALLIASRDGHIESWPRTQNSPPSARSQGIDPSGTEWEASPDGAFMAWLDASKAVRLLHVASGQLLPGPIGRFDSLRISPDGNAILLVNATGASLFTFNPRQQSVVAAGSVAAVAFHPSGRIAAAGLADGSLCIIDVGNPRVSTRRKASAQAILAIAFAPHSQTMLTGDAEGALRFWNTTLWRELLQLHFPKPIRIVALSPDSQHLAVVADGRLHLLDATGAAGPHPSQDGATAAPWLAPGNPLQRLARPVDHTVPREGRQF